LGGILTLSIPELSREKLRTLRSLSSAKLRRKRGLCLVEGERALAEASRSGKLQYLVTEKRGAGEAPLSLHSALPSAQLPADLPIFTLEKEVFGELSDVKSGTGLLGVAGIPQEASLDALMASGGVIKFLFMDAVQEPGNVGTLIRTAWALGFSGVLLGHGTADPFSRKGVRASAGAAFHIPIFEEIGPEKVDPLLDAGFSLFFAEGGATDYRKVSFPDKVVLVLGNEGAGISSWVRDRGNGVGIPMAEGVDSLNVVVAGAIIASRITGL
jgi:TrmH family RNA methyltransferase